jgi:hypothetical protein
VWVWDGKLGLDGLDWIGLEIVGVAVHRVRVDGTCTVARMIDRRGGCGCLLAIRAWGRASR